MGYVKLSLDEMLRLPDHVFGRRFVISCATAGIQDTVQWDISELAFPNIAIIWGIHFWSTEPGINTDWIRLAVGPRLPTSVAEMNELPDLIQGLGYQQVRPRRISMNYIGFQNILNMRTVIHSNGGHLILELDTMVTQGSDVTVAVVTSGVPKEVPDWLISGRAKRQW